MCRPALWMAVSPAEIQIGVVRINYRLPIKSLQVSARVGLTPSSRFNPSDPFGHINLDCLQRKRQGNDRFVYRTR